MSVPFGDPPTKINSPGTVARKGEVLGAGYLLPQLDVGLAGHALQGRSMRSVRAGSLTVTS